MELHKNICKVTFWLYEGCSKSFKTVGITFESFNIHQTIYIYHKSDSIHYILTEFEQNQCTNKQFRYNIHDLCQATRRKEITSYTTSVMSRFIARHYNTTAFRSTRHHVQYSGNGDEPTVGKCLCTIHCRTVV